MRYAPAAALAAVVLSLVPLGAWATHSWRAHHARDRAVRLLPYPKRDLPLQIAGSQYLPLNFADLAGWNEDDHLAAFRAFRTSCRPIAAQSVQSAEDKALGHALRDPCRVARESQINDSPGARLFFEQNFVPLQISRLGESEGFVTGYYEPVLEGSRTRSDVYHVPVYRRPSNLFVRGFSQDAPSLPNKGAVYRKIGRRKLVPYYDRAQIEDGAIAGRGLEIAWLKSETDLLFAQIQGSARIRLDDGSTVRINYDAHNGFPYTAVGRVLIERGIIPREQMSMQRIRDWMDQNPDAANEVRRQNRAYVFFREVQLSDKDEPVGAQGVPLAAGRSIAVDSALHVYGTPFFIEGDLPIETAQSKTPFHRLMIAQDTGSAIVGPARADLYFGTGAEAGRISGRLKHPMTFVMLVPKQLDPSARGRGMPVPDPRPSQKIAKLFPQTPNTGPSNEQSIPQRRGDAKSPMQEQRAVNAAASAMAQVSAPAASAIPLPEPRPATAPEPAGSHRRR